MGQCLILLMYFNRKMYPFTERRSHFNELFLSTKEKSAFLHQKETQLLSSKHPEKKTNQIRKPKRIHHPKKVKA